MQPVRSPTYPGTPEHQQLLRAIADHYADDARVLAVAVFGSLGRGTWVGYSDLDLDVVIADGVTLDAPEEVQRLRGVLGQQPVVVLPDRDDAADVVLASLMELSIQQAFLCLLDLLEHDLAALSADQARLTDAQRQVIAQLRTRQARLDLNGS